MSELVTISISVLTVCMSAIIPYVILKKYINPEKISEIFEFVVDDALQNEAMQKKIYTLGGLIGSGVRQGIGIQKQGSGKFKMEDLIMSFAGNFLNSKLGGLGMTQQDTSQQQEQGSSLVGVLR